MGLPIAYGVCACLCMQQSRNDSACMISLQRLLQKAVLPLMAGPLVFVPGQRTWATLRKTPEGGGC